MQVQSPLTLVLQLSRGSFEDLLDEIVLLMHAAKANALIKAGALLEQNGTTQYVRMSEHTENEGRRLESYSLRRDVGNTKFHISEIFSKSKILFQEESFCESSLLFNNSECISISDLADELLEPVIDLAKDSGMLMATVRWKIDDPIAVVNLWQRLILTRIVANGEILMSYEEIPLEEIYDEQNMRWRPSRPPWLPATGYFFEYFNQIFPDDTHTGIEMPPNIPFVAPPRRVLSPLQQALSSVGVVPVTRISTMDKGDQKAEFKAPYPDLEFPDVVAIEKKVRGYCLNPSQDEQKWIGFRIHGWDGSHPLHSTKLAALFASALLSSFEPIDPRITADGALQFSLAVALPSWKGGYVPVTTAWVAKPGKQIELATAFVDSGTKHALQPTMAFEKYAAADWKQIADSAIKFAELVPYDDVWAMPIVLISRMGHGSDFCRALVKDGGSFRELRRSALGGRCIQVPIIRESIGWERAGRATAFAQVQLGLAGILALQASLVD